LPSAKERGEKLVFQSMMFITNTETFVGIVNLHDAAFGIVSRKTWKMAGCREASEASEASHGDLRPKREKTRETQD
jgi:hypothetical protein